MNLRRAASLITIIVGGVLAVFFWGVHWQWFQCGPLGLALIGLGFFELLENRQSNGRDQRPFIQTVQREVMDILGIGNNRTSTKRSGSDSDA